MLEGHIKGPSGNCTVSEVHKVATKHPYAAVLHYCSKCSVRNLCIVLCIPVEEAIGVSMQILDGIAAKVKREAWHIQG